MSESERGRDPLERLPRVLLFCYGVLVINAAAVMYGQTLWHLLSP